MIICALYVSKTMGAKVNDDPKENEARKHFKDFNFENINKQSISISILTIYASAWEAILENNYGKPIDKSDKGNGKKYTIDSYLRSNQPSGTLYVTIWNKPKQPRSTILENCNMKMNIDFLNEKIPELFEEVLRIKTIDDGNDVIEIVEKQSTKKLETKSGPRNPTGKPIVKCEECSFKSSLLQMKMHMRRTHGPKPKKSTKRLSNFTPVVKAAKRAKSTIVNNDGIVDTDGCFLVNETLNGKQVTTMNAEGIVVGIMDRLIDESSVVMDDSIVTRKVNATILSEDMSVSGLSDSEELLLENKTCDKCDFTAANEDFLEKHMDECHSMKTGLALNEEISNAPSFGKPLALYLTNVRLQTQQLEL